MSPYRKEVDKMYNKIIRIASRGNAALQNYYGFIDEVIENGQSVILQDVMATKFKIDTTTFRDIDSLKKNTFKKIGMYIETSANRNLSSLYLEKGVFTVGTQFFDIITSQYLGDIRQFDTDKISQGLEIYTFNPQFMKSTIPTFVPSPSLILEYKKDYVVSYENRLYLCCRPYTWDRINRITPTYSYYWTEIYAGTQSFHTIDDPELSLLDRYSNSIDILRTYSFKDYSRNNYMETNYIDEYFE